MKKWFFLSVLCISTGCQGSSSENPIPTNTPESNVSTNPSYDRVFLLRNIQNELRLQPTMDNTVSINGVSYRVANRAALDYVNYTCLIHLIASNETTPDGFKKVAFFHGVYGYAPSNALVSMSAVERRRITTALSYFNSPDSTTPIGNTVGPCVLNLRPNDIQNTRIEIMDQAFNRGWVSTQVLMNSSSVVNASATF